MGFWLPGGMQCLEGCRGILNHPRALERGWGNALHPLGWGHWGPTRTGGGHQPSGAATGAGAWGPLHPLATRYPPRGLGPASLTYFGPTRDKGGLCSSAQAEEGWEAVAGGWGGGRGAQPALGLWDHCLHSPGPLCPCSLGNTRGLDTREALGSPRCPACSEVPISPRTWVREPSENGLQGTSLRPPFCKPHQGWSRIPPAPAKAALGHPERHPVGCLGVPPEPPPPRAGSG